MCVIGVLKFWFSVCCLCEEYGVDLEMLVLGSGLGGYLIAADVLRRVGVVDAATLEKLGL